MELNCIPQSLAQTVMSSIHASNKFPVIDVSNYISRLGVISKFNEDGGERGIIVIVINEYHEQQGPPVVHQILRWPNQNTFHSK